MKKPGKKEEKEFVPAFVSRTVAPNATVEESHREETKQTAGETDVQESAQHTVAALFGEEVSDEQLLTYFENVSQG